MYYITQLMSITSLKYSRMLAKRFETRTKSGKTIDTRQTRSKLNRKAIHKLFVQLKKLISALGKYVYVIDLIRSRFV